MSAVTASKIFICYRRDDSAPYAGRIFADLRSHDLPVFMDLGIEIGDRFDAEIEREIASCDAVLVIIGQNWLTATDEDGRDRLTKPDDYVRREIAIALQRDDVVVIPLLVRQASMPRASALPEPLVALAGRRAFEIRDDRWNDDLRVVVDRLRRLPGREAPAKTGDRNPWVRYVALGTLLAALVALMAVIAVTTFSTGASHHRPPPVTIGALFALSGTARGANAEVVNGVQFGVDYINDMKDPDSQLPLKAGQGLPGRGGAKLHLVVENVGKTRCSVEGTFAGLVDRDHVSAVVGANESTVTLRAIVAADRRGVPLVNAGSTAANLTTPPPGSQPLKTCGKPQDDPRPSPWFFRIGPDDTQIAGQFFAMLDEAKQHGEIRGVRKIAIVQEGGDIYGNGGASALAHAAKGQGFQVRRFKYPSVLGTSIDVTDNDCPQDELALLGDLDRLVADVRAYKPQLVFAVSYLPDAITIVQKLGAIAGFPPVALLGSGSSFLSDAFIQGVGEGNPGCGDAAPGPADPDGIIAQAAWAADPKSASATSKRIATLFQARYKQPMSSRSAGGFTAVMTLAQAISAAKSDHPADIRDALHDLNVPADRTIMPWNGIHFDTRGQNMRAQVVLEQLIAGRYRVVYPDSEATAPAIFPLARAKTSP